MLRLGVALPLFRKYMYFLQLLQVNPMFFNEKDCYFFPFLVFLRALFEKRTKLHYNYD